ncbi:MAG: LUD domain-containing protein [Rhodothermales bacterium]|nr:LUD domain-containing protein [Rhodothermales bacterium]
MSQQSDSIALFRTNLENSGAKVHVIGKNEIEDTVNDFSDFYGQRFHGDIALRDFTNVGSIAAPADLDGAALFVCTGQVGVAENGAIWLSDSNCIHRAALFLPEAVALVIEATSIVPTMHEAYEQIQIDAEGFGIFVAGPSKTADIEQSLVIGAHGPRSLHVLITS